MCAYSGMRGSVQPNRSPFFCTLGAVIFTLTTRKRKYRLQISGTNKWYTQNVKFFPSHKAHIRGADLCFLSPLTPQPDCSLHCETTDTGLFTPQLSLVICAYPQKDDQAELIWWLVIYRDGLPVRRQSSIQVLTNHLIATWPGVEPTISRSQAAIF